ncbi:MAG: O-antigen ligase family protein [Cyanobacteria bacterium P01_D01_bin.105]
MSRAEPNKIKTEKMANSQRTVGTDGLMEHGAADPFPEQTGDEWRSAHTITPQSTDEHQNSDRDSQAFSSLWTQITLGILLARSALDLYSGRGIPAAFAIAVDLFVFAFIARQWVLRKPIHTDRFWWVIMGWIALQGIWVTLLPIGGLGGTAAMTPEALREWVRFFSLGMVYLLTMQLRDRIPPDRLASLLLLSLVVPLSMAALQMTAVDLPGFLQSDLGWKDFAGNSDRINSTLGHYNSFASFTLLFIALTLWRLQISQQRWKWVLLLGGLLYCLVATRSLTGLAMLIVFGGLYFLPRLKGKGLLGALALAVALGILLSTELGQARLVELTKTPLLNPDLTFQQAAALQAADMAEFRNSFNWRLLQWRDLFANWQLHPWLGYGLASTKSISIFDTTSHNDYLRFLVEGGVAGLSLFLAFMVAQIIRTLQLIRQSLPRSPQRALAQALFPFSVALMVGMVTGNVMVHTATLFYWWVLLALLGWNWPNRLGTTPAQKHLSQHDSSRKHLIINHRSRKHTDELAPAFEAPTMTPEPPVSNQATYDTALYDEDIYRSSRYDLDGDI